MTEGSPIDYQARLKEALLALTKVRTRLETLERQQNEPIAIIGIGCRFPGDVTDPESFWELLHNGVDAISEVPADRWDIDAYYNSEPGTPGKMYTPYGGFLRDVDKFDPTFFGISPREANSMDPQQRLLLEVAWEALENAGQAPDQLGESATGVYIGVTMNDYVQVQSNIHSPDLTGTYRITGNLFNSIAGRVSYTLGLRGPAMALDTACSSSLVAIHQAIQSLRSGETTMALAGGVNLLLSPEITLSACQANMLAPDGRCKTFDSRADGFIRSDGIGVVVLKRLSDALQNGDRIWALIRGSAVNHDGFSSGFSVPNKLAQEEVIKSALHNAGVTPHQIGYVEAHGTGTSLGDPIEVRALDAVLCQGRDISSPLFLGSVKTNIGHTEATAGAAGLIKAVLALHYREIPPHLHLQKLNPFMEWSKAPLSIPTKPTAFPTINGRRIAGVSSFGVSGINAHIVLESAPEVANSQNSDGERSTQLLRLSAYTAEGLKLQAGRLTTYLQNHPQSSLADICFTENIGRANFRHRLALTATSLTELQEKLSAFSSGADSSSIIQNLLDPEDKLKIAFLFTGHASQYMNMGRKLYATSPIFKSAVEECEVLLQSYLDISINRMMYPEPGEEASVAALWDGMKYTQPAQFVLAYALVKLWKSWGIAPGAVIGHSVGEYAAACAAGVMSLADGIKLVAARGRLMDSLPQQGVMVAVFAEESTVVKSIAPYADKVSIAVINGPTNIVISGNAQAIETIQDELSKQAIKFKRLDVAQASHSPFVDPMLDEFESIAATIAYHQPGIEYISSLTGESESKIDSKYWRMHQRQTVRFADALQTLLAQGYNHLIEIGPTPALITIAQRNLDEADATLGFYSSLHKGQDDWNQILGSLGDLYVHGADVDWRGFDQLYPRQRLSLPTYPFQRQRYWITPGSKRGSIQSKDTLHPLLGSRLQSAAQEIIFENELSSQEPAFLADHVVNEQTILPATAYIEMLLAVGREVMKSNDAAFAVDDLVIHAPLQLSDMETVTVQTIVNRKIDDEIACKIFSQDRITEQWKLHASAVVRLVSGQSSATSLADIRSRCKEIVSAEEHYQRMAARGLSFGPAFRGLSSLWLGKSEALARIESPDAVTSALSSYELYPAVLDAALQTVAALLPRGDKTYLPISVDSVNVFNHIQSTCWSHATIAATKHSSTEILTANINLFDDNGSLLVAIAGFTLKQASRSSIDSWLYEVNWQIAPQTKTTPQEFASLLQSAFNNMAKDPQMISYQQEFLPRMDALCSALIQNALLEMGWSFEAGSIFSFEEASSQLHVAKQHRRLLNRLLEILEEDGLLARVNNTLKVIRPLAKTNMTNEAEHLRAVYPDARIEMDMVERIGGEFALAMQGQRDPLELLFPGGSLVEAEELYRDAPFTRGFNQLIREAVKEFVKNWHEDRPIRILEIGAGTGGTTSYILSQLSHTQVEYTFTDISPLFLNRAQEKLSAYDFFQYRTLDIERDPSVQGFDSHCYDLILATNVLHATSNLHATMKRVNELLASGGYLFAVEGTRKQRFADIIVGLTPGWWGFSDSDLRLSYALLSQSNWIKLMEQSGFVSAQGITGMNVMSNQSLLVAQAGLSLPKNESGTWLLFAKHNALSDQIAERLSIQNQTVNFVHAGNIFHQNKDDSYQVAGTCADDFQKLIQSTGSVVGVVYLWALDHLNSTDSQSTLCGGLLYLVQALVANGQACPIWVVTQGAQSTNGPTMIPHHATLWGLCRVINQEHPELFCRVLDLDPNQSAQEENINNLWMEISALNKEDQIAFRDNERFVPRLIRAQIKQLAESPEIPVKLTIADRGVLDTLVYEEVARKSPAQDEVEIHVLATGISFRDVLNSLGMYPGGGELGSECAGIISEIGPGVENIQVGDSVIAFALGSFASYVIAPARYVVRKPTHLTFPEAATIPSAFLTTQYALNHLAKMKAGDRVLIHAAAGGVGLAAVQLAQNAGAEIFATAGSPAKREMLKSLGVQHVMDSRTLDFADEIIQMTNGKGVDIVLNSLADDFIPKSISVLAEYGRFIEIGKRGIWNQVQFAQVKSNAFYRTVDLLLEAKENEDLIPALFQQIMPGFENGTLKPLPLQIYPTSKAIEAFRHMAQGRHTGKLVIVPEPLQLAIHPNATYLITGGLGGLGLAVADWLAELGAKHLALVGRSAPNEQARAALKKLTDADVNVKVFQADVSDREALADVFAQIQTSMPPLRGVIHAAGVLDDGVLSQQTWERFETVFAPKVQGGWNLHELTKGLPLDFFVLFSSAVSLIGSAGQANHVAASTFLDMLARYRHGRGLPALSIDWGPWTQVGVAAEREVSERLLNRGVESISPAQGIEALSSVMNSNRFIQVGIAPVNWTRFTSQSSSPFFAQMKQQVQVQTVKSTPTVHHSQQDNDLWQRLQSAPEGKRRNLLLSHVREQALKVLSLPPDFVLEQRQPLQELGLDSLMAVELRNRLGKGLPLSHPLPATLVFDYPTADALSRYLMDDLFVKSQTPEPSTNVTEKIEPLAAAELSDEEAEALLLAELNELKKNLGSDKDARYNQL